MPRAHGTRPVARHQRHEELADPELDERVEREADKVHADQCDAEPGDEAVHVEHPRRGGPPHETGRELQAADHRQRDERPRDDPAGARRVPPGVRRHRSSLRSRLGSAPPWSCARRSRCSGCPAVPAADAVPDSLGRRVHGRDRLGRRRRAVRQRDRAGHREERRDAQPREEDSRRRGGCRRRLLVGRAASDVLALAEGVGRDRPEAARRSCRRRRRSA